MPTDAAVQRALAAEIRALMSRRDMTHSELAYAAGVSPSAYRTYFRTYTRDVPMKVLIAIADVLDVRASMLLAAAEASASEYEQDSP
jgi:transcriptional regulator with XRE-family HTH domain